MVTGPMDNIPPMTASPQETDPQPRFRHLLAGDVAALKSGPKGPLFFLAALVGLNKFSAILLYRLASHFRNQGRFFRPLSSLTARMNLILNGCELSPASQIGPGLHLPHPGGIVLGAISAGRNLSVMENVTIGLLDRRADYELVSNFARIGTGVWIGPGAVVSGPVRIGDGAEIEANAVVISDIPDGGIAVSNPAKILPGKSE